LPSARNSGILIAQGEYIAHCDSDDWVEPTMYEELYKKAITKNADIVWSDFIMNTKEGELYYKMMAPSDKKVDTIKLYLSFGWNVVWNMIVKHNLYKEFNLRSYERYNFTEDYGLTIRLVYHAKNIVYIENAFYHYNRENLSSIVHQELDKDKRERIFHDEVSICCLTNEFFVKEGVYDTFEKELSWRMLKAKRGWLYDIKHWGDYKKTYPESNKHLSTNPLVSKKDKISQKLFLKTYTRPFILVIIILDKIYKRLKLK
jgi:glycosyltransferase involved in cell wall biosynthesis